MCPVFPDEGPADQSISGHRRGPIHSLYCADGPFVVLDEVVTIGCDRKGVSRVQDDIDQGIVGLLSR